MKQKKISKLISLKKTSNAKLRVIVKTYMSFLLLLFFSVISALIQFIKIITLKIINILMLDDKTKKTTLKISKTIHCKVLGVI